MTSADKNSITVANFFRTQTVDLAGSPVNATSIKVGDKVKIQKNLQGNVLYVRTFSNHDAKDGHEKWHERNHKQENR